MRTFSPVALALFALGCSSAEDRQSAVTMDRIEQQVRLPADALRLHQYARYYALDGERIVGTYITHVDPENKYYDLPIGRRRWIADSRNLPGISDGGCSVVKIVYDVPSSKVQQASCNGVA
jgi:hypothetical protein